MHIIHDPGCSLAAALDLLSCREFLATGTVFEQRTLFEGIEKLEPASIYYFQSGCRLSRTRYWDLASVVYDRAPITGDVPQMAAALEETFAVIAHNFRRPVMDLTGGFDSRALLAAMLKTGVDFDTVVNGAPSDPDVLTAQAIAQAFGLRHRHQVPAVDTGRSWWEKAVAALPLCDGEYDLLKYAVTYDVQTRLAAEFDATINGSNGEICKGYWWELLFPFTGRRGHFNERAVAAGRFAVATEDSLLERSFPTDLVAHFAGVIRRANAAFDRYPNTAKLDNVYLTLRMQRWQGRIASATSRIWPHVSPFMFRLPMEIALSTPPAVRVRHRMTRRLIEYLNPRLSEVPLAGGFPAAPMRLRNLAQFWPLAVETARKAQKRLGKLLPAPREAPPGPLSNPMLLLWELEEVRDTLDQQKMLTAGLYHRDRLKDYLAKTRAAEYRSNSPFGRILTLELLARAIQPGVCKHN